MTWLTKDFKSGGSVMINVTTRGCQGYKLKRKKNLCTLALSGNGQYWIIKQFIWKKYIMWVG